MQATVDGEPLEIFPFVGSSRLEEPLNRFPVSVVIHGHAHRGQPEGRTKAGAPVYNVSMPLLTRMFPEVPPFRLIEIPIAPSPALAVAGGATESTPSAQRRRAGDQQNA